MNASQFFIYLLLIAGSTYLLRAVPFAALNKKIESPRLKAFLAYIPYTVLTAMTLPNAITDTGTAPIAAAVGLALACFFAIRGKDLTVVALITCAVAFACDWLLTLLP